METEQPYKHMRKKMVKKKRRQDATHETAVELLYQRLTGTGIFDFVSKDVRYNLVEACGQIDVMAYIHDENKDVKYFYFYEVKSTDTFRNKKKAQSQYDRYRNCHPKQNLEGYYVAAQTLEGVVTLATIEKLK